MTLFEWRALSATFHALEILKHVEEANPASQHMKEAVYSESNQT